MAVYLLQFKQLLFFFHVSILKCAETNYKERCKSCNETIQHRIMTSLILVNKPIPNKSLLYSLIILDLEELFVIVHNIDGCMLRSKKVSLEDRTYSACICVLKQNAPHL